MATLIDRDKCQERIFRFADRLVDWGYPEQAKAVRAAAKGIKLEKTVDAVEVVRCKDCEQWGGVAFGNVCKRWSAPLAGMKNCTGPDDFCSYGERRTDG